MLRTEQTMKWAAILFAGLLLSEATMGGKSHGIWGRNRGSLMFTATRKGILSCRARTLPHWDDSKALHLRFRFKTKGAHAYGALALIGLRAR